MTKPMPNQDEIHFILARLRHIVSSPHPEKYVVDVRTILKTYRKLEGKSEYDHTTFLEFKSELTLLLTAVLRKTRDLPLLKVLVEHLFLLPPMGPFSILFCFQEKTCPQALQKSLLESLAIKNQLILANLGLLCHEQCSEFFLNWAQSRLEYLKARNNHHVQEFFAFCTRHRIGLSRPVKAAAFVSKYFNRFHCLLEKESNSAELSAQLKIVALLESPRNLENCSPCLTSSPDDVLLAVLATVKDTPGVYSEEFVNDLSGLLEHPRIEVVSLALQILITLAPDRASRAMASLYERKPHLKKLITGSCLLLDLPRFMTFYRALPQKKRTAVIESVVTGLLHFDPEGVKRVLNSEILGTGNSWFSENRNKLLSLMDVQSGTIISRLAPGRGTSEFQNGKRATGTTISQEFFLDRLFFASDLDVSEITLSSFTDCGFENIPFSMLRGRDTSFTGCRFFRCNFDHAFFSRSTFNNCSFVECSFKEAVWDRLEFVHTVFTKCSFLNGTLSGCAGEDLTFAVCNLFKLRMADCALTRFTATECNFSSALFVSTCFSGSELTLCSFERSSLLFLTTRGMRVCGCAFTEARGMNMATEVPDLLEISQKFLQAELHAFSCKQGFLKPLLSVPVQDAEELIVSWFKMRSLLQAREKFLINNVRRLNTALERLTFSQRTFFEVMPLLLTTNLTGNGFVPSDKLPALRVSGYEPPPGSWSLARKLFDLVEYPEQRRTRQIQAIYSIGSTGSVAQTEHSDLDYWICADLSGWTDQELNAFRQKLDDLTAWVRLEFDTEAHFFLQDINRVRRNDFESVDHESSGTAQGILLKEEFYRTGLKIAGLSPLWWLTPPKSSRETYHEISEWTRLLGFGVIDFGYLNHIPSGEFFGASLWQIVKSFKSPFKSILKFGLLEKYVRRFKRPLLCEDIKENILAGYHDLLTVDPYIILFREVWNYYCMAGDKQTLEILKFSFLQKTGMTSEDLHTLFGESLQGLYCVEDLISFQDANPMGVDTLEHVEFNRLMEIEQNLNKYMVRTYIRIQEGMSGKGKVCIEQSDLNRLGRKIFTVFAPRTDKVEHLPYTINRRSIFEELYLSSSQDQEGSREWLVRGKQLDPVSNRYYLSEVNRGRDLVTQLTWLVANGLYRPEMQIKTDFTVSPVTKEDISRLLTALHGFFPLEIFDTDINEGLNAELVLKAFLILNMVQPRATGRIYEASICYCTNWGELFCKTVSVKKYTTPLQPKRFIFEHIAMDFAPSCLYGIYIPQNASCLRNLPAPDAN